jgi:tripeptidyl-peptidase-1
MFAPDQKTVDMVKEWLTDFAISDERIIQSNNEGWLVFDTTKDEAERLLHTTYDLYEYSNAGHVMPAYDK